MSPPPRHPRRRQDAAHSSGATTSSPASSKWQYGSQHDGAHSHQPTTPTTTNRSHRRRGPHQHTPRHHNPQVSKEEAIYIWSHSVLLANNSEISQSLVEHRRLLRVCGNTIPRSLLHFNMGSLWSLANDTNRASEAFEQSCREDPTLTIAWFCLGISQYSVQNYPQALDAFETCLSTYADSEMVKNYEPQGLDFKIEKTKVTWNIHLTQYRLAKQMGRPPPRLALDNPLNTIHKALYFDAPEIDGTEGDGNDSAWKQARRRSALEKLTSQLKKLRKFSFSASQDDGKEKRDSGWSEDTTTTGTGSARRSQGSSYRSR